MKAYVALAKAFVDQEIETLFGVMGDGNMQYIAAYEDEFSGHYVGAVDERGAVSMADGFARARRSVGVVSVTHGPGFTNSITSLVEAAKARTPLVVLTADTPGAQRRHIQEIDTEGLARPTGAGFLRVTRADRVVEDFGRALQQASLESRPVVLNVPVDLLETEVEYQSARFGKTRLPALAPSPATLDEALGIIASARSPLILAGRGAVLADAKDALVRLADVCQAPLATTLPARGYFNGHPLNIGICGTLAHPIAIDVIAASDVVVAFGASLNEKTTDSGALLRGKTVIQCDLDEARFNLYDAANVLVHGDASATATAMADMLEAADLRASARNGDLAQRLAARRPENEFTDRSGGGTVDGRSASIHLDNVIPANRSTVSDGGRFLQGAWRYLQPIDGTANTTSVYFGSIGLGMGTAVGFAVGRPDLLTVAMLGDGGGMMGIKEFSTAVRNNLRVAVVVFNDGSYGAEYSKLEDFGLDPKYSLLTWPRFCDIAEALGGRGIRVESLADIDALGPETWQSENLPVLIEVMMDPTVDLYHW